MSGEWPEWQPKLLAGGRLPLPHHSPHSMFVLGKVILIATEALAAAALCCLPSLTNQMALDTPLYAHKV